MTIAPSPPTLHHDPIAHASTSFHVLGPLRVLAGDRDVTPPGPKIGRILALLLLRAGRPVGVDAMADELWSEQPPRSAVATVRTHVYHLRSRLPVDLRIATSATGYRLEIDRDRLDCNRFQESVRRGAELLGAGDAAAASVLLDEALTLWQGDALDGLVTGPLLAGHVRLLEEMRQHALELRIEARLALGGHRQLLPELRWLVATEPLNEWYHARLIEALHSAGRRNEALAAYRDLHRLLADELGLEPCADVQKLHQELLGARTLRAV